MRHRSEDMQQPVATALVWWCCAALFSIGVFPCRAGCDTWVKSVGNGTAPIYDGFGSVSNIPANKGVEWLRVFNGSIYAAVGQEESGSGHARGTGAGRHTTAETPHRRARFHPFLLRAISR